MGTFTEKDFYMSDRKLKLGAFLMSPGHHVAGWRHPSAQADLGQNFKAYVAIAQEAEAAKFDMLFLDDTVAVKNTSRDVGPRLSRAAFFEPTTLLSGLAAVTERIGLVGTASTTYNDPYTLARKFASLDLISAGRGAWNLVTSNTEEEAANYSAAAHPRHADRYARAEEFIDVALGLWRSYDDDAFLLDQQSGQYYDPDKQHVLDHKGAFYAVRGPLNVARSAQGHPVVVQAGSSEPGKELAARTAEVVFTASQSLEDSVSFYADLKGRMAKYGRHPDDLKIMPGIFPVVGESRAQAQEKFEELQELIHPAVAVAQLQYMLGDFDLSPYPVDGPLPELPESNGGKSRQALLFDLARKEKLSIAQLARRIAGARGHWQVVGTAADIVDVMEERFVKQGADGFNIMPPTLPGGLRDFIAFVVPELRRRGLFREEYEGRTLRENLGLKFPAHRGEERVSRVG